MRSRNVPEEQSLLSTSEALLAINFIILPATSTSVVFFIPFNPGKELTSMTTEPRSQRSKSTLAIGNPIVLAALMAVLFFFNRQDDSLRLRVTIMEFNKRSQRVWQHLKFEQVEKFIKTNTKGEFVVMTCAISSCKMKSNAVLNPTRRSFCWNYLKRKILAWEGHIGLIAELIIFYSVKLLRKFVVNFYIVLILDL